MTPLKICLLISVTVGFSSAFLSPTPTTFFRSTTMTSAKKNGDDEKAPVVQKFALSVGTLVEFGEKSRTHVGKILSVDHKSNGNNRYNVEDHDGKVYHIADKAVSFSMSTSNSAGDAEKLFLAFTSAQAMPEKSLREQLEVSPDLMEMAWEEATEGTELTPSQFIDIIHSHAATKIESYMAWRLLKQDMAHVFFKELKQHGRVVAFKAKASKAVDAAKNTFCMNPDHQDEYEFCFV